MSELPPLSYLEPIAGRTPEFVELVEEVRRRALYTPGALDVKTKLLIAFALDVARHRQGGARQLAERARAFGATEDELVEVLQIRYSVSGMQSLSLGAPALDLE